MFSLLRWTWNREGSFSESKYIHHRHCLLLLLNPSIKPMALFPKGHHPPGNNRCNLKTKWNKTTQSVTPKDVFQVICCHQMSLWGESLQIRLELRTSANAKNLKHRYFSDRMVFVGQVQLKDKRLLSPKRVEPQACHSLTVPITSQCTCNDLADDKDDDHDKHYLVFT